MHMRVFRFYRWAKYTQALPLILLYRQERTQYDITVQKLPGKSPSEIYGAEHLLRVFGEWILFWGGRQFFSHNVLRNAQIDAATHSLIVRYCCLRFNAVALAVVVVAVSMNAPLA